MVIEPDFRHVPVQLVEVQRELIAGSKLTRVPLFVRCDAT